MTRDPGGGLAPLLSPEQLRDKLSLAQESIFGRGAISCFSVQDGKIPVSLCPCTGWPACPILLPSAGAAPRTVPASSPILLLKALYDDGGGVGGAVHPYWCYWEEEKCPVMRTRDLYGN